MFVCAESADEHERILFASPFGLRLISWLCKMCPYWLTVDTTCHASKRSVYFNCRMICVITALHLGLELLEESFSLRVGANLNLMTFSRY